MKKLITLGIFTLFVTTIFGQKLDYDNDSKWFWGINTGIAWSTTDVKTKHTAAWGLTLGKAFNYNYGKKISFDIRARYLGGKWRGQDYDTTSLLDYNKEFTPFGNVKTKYDTLGYTINNFQTQIHEFGLELVIHANSVRENSGWDPYIFGGVNLVLNQTKGNLLYKDTFLFDEYIYNYAPGGITKTEWKNISDNEYDLALDGSSQNKFNLDFMPSLGFGLAYQVGPRFSVGAEHKTTFALKDVFDGYVNPELRVGLFENDIYHYTSAFLRFQIRRKKATGNTDFHNTGTNTNTNGIGTNNPPPCNLPKIRISSPRNNSLTVYNNQYLIKGLIEELAGRENIVLKINGVQSTNFIFNRNNENFESPVLLSPGTNIITVEAGNACGSDMETITMNYVNCIAPIVQFVNPQNGVTVDRADLVVNATAVNSQSVEYYVNGVKSTSFTHNTATGNFTSNTPLQQGANSLRIIATNDCGTVEQTITVTYTNCVSPFISIQNGSGSQIVDKATFVLKATMSSVENKNNVSLRLNGMNKTFSYNAATGLFESVVQLARGTNTFELFASNDCGSDSETTTVEYVPCSLPKISRIAPTISSTETETILVKVGLQEITSSSQIKLLVNGVYVTTGNFNAVTMTFEANVKLIHGQNVIKIIVSNDCGSDEEIINILHADCKAPIVNLILPTDRSTENSMQLVKASLQNVTSSSQIQLIVNGVAISGGTFNPSTNIFQANVKLQNGSNTIKIVATNDCGTSQATTTISFTPCEEVKANFIEPTVNSTTSGTILVKASVTNITNESQVQLIVNNVTVGGGTYNSSTNVFQANVTLQNGLNTIEILATNDCSSKSIKVEVLKTIESTGKLTICHYSSADDKWTEMTIVSSDWVAHQAHGDRLGPCAIDDNNDDGQDEKITICHIPPGNNQNPQEITIPLSAWPAHQAHGDNLGPCPIDDNNDDDQGGNDTNQSAITICHKNPKTGKTTEIKIPLSEWATHQSHGDKLGPCSTTITGNGTDHSNNPSTQVNITICHKNLKTGEKSQIVISEKDWLKHKAHGDTKGACVLVVDDVEEMITICHSPTGTSIKQQMEIPASEWQIHKVHGDTQGPCPVVVDPNAKFTICHKVPGSNETQEMEVTAVQWLLHKSHGDTLGACPEQKSGANKKKGSTIGKP